MNRFRGHSVGSPAAWSRQIGVGGLTFRGPESVEFRGYAISGRKKARARNDATGLGRHPDVAQPTPAARTIAGLFFLWESAAKVAQVSRRAARLLQAPVRSSSPGAVLVTAPKLDGAARHAANQQDDPLAGPRL
jgi:hypothetical protein